MKSQPSFQAYHIERKILKLLVQKNEQNQDVYHVEISLCGAVDNGL